MNDYEVVQLDEEQLERILAVIKEQGDRIVKAIDGVYDNITDLDRTVRNN